MTSLNPQISALHLAYCEAMAIEPEDLPMTYTFEEWWGRASNQGVTPDMVRVVIKERLAFNRKGGFKRGLELRHLIRSDEDVSVVINEYAAWKASTRIKVLDKGKAEVLRATHRPDTVPTPEPVSVGSLKLIQDLRKAVQ